MSNSEHRQAERAAPDAPPTDLLMAMLSGLPPAILREAAHAAERREWRERELKKLVARDLDQAEAAVASTELRAAVTELQRKVFILEACGTNHLHEVAEQPSSRELVPDLKHLPEDVWDRIRVLPESARAGG